MAGVAGGGAVTVAALTLVYVVRLCLLVRRRRVAIDASKAGIVRRNLVAVVAHRAVVRNLEIGMVECGAKPAGGRVAGIACLWIARRDVIRHCPAKRLGAEPRSLVASVTIGVRRSQAEIVAHVAIRAGRDLRSRGWRHLVRPRERPACGAVIKRPRIPRSGVVASGAERSREARGDVIGNRAAQRLRTVPFIRVATVTIRIGAGQSVVVIDMAGSARRCQVRARERPTRRAVIKIR